MKVAQDPKSRKIVPDLGEEVRNPSPSTLFTVRAKLETNRFGAILKRQISHTFTSDTLASINKYTIAFLSISDMVTDIIMTSRYFANGEETYAKASLTCILLNMGLVSLVTFFTNRQRPCRTIFKEQIVVWSLMKPALDAHRVANKQEQEEGMIIDAGSEMTIGRIIEMVTESIPGTCIQMSAIITNKDFTKTALLSLSSSILTTAFISAQITYDWDTDDKKRRFNPRFYGFMPRRLYEQIIVGALLLLMSMFNLMIRSTSCVLIGMSFGVHMVVLVLGGELLMYLMFKVVRRDFDYWVVVTGITLVFCNVSLRILMKIAVDWACITHFRHPLELGGGYFSFTMALTILVGMSVALVYRQEDTEITGEDDGIEERFVVYFMAGCCTGLTLSYATFLKRINQKFVRTFFDTRTGDEYLASEFRRSLKEDNDTDTGDSFKHNIFAYNERKWKYIIEDEVKCWLNENVTSWLDSKADFFTDFRKSQIPTWAIDDPVVLNRIRNKKVREMRSHRENIVLKTLRPGTK
ncbi:hypothetical protein TrST_g13245 [Triparma strigata]|uniref:Uncharacterized protein n=1 Tax=Triparma strigata TaxID=1606541 RepID=A0A9W7ANL8_9STRA|nr:hypothetical protein TrST_g13245 [Triparma strigata]